MKIINRILQEIRNLIYEIRVKIIRIPDRINYDVPYVCQFATPESAELSLKKKLLPENDPNWKDTGAKSAKRYADWAFTMCGMACAAMALHYFKNEKYKEAELAEDALQSGVYHEDEKEISNMKYREFAKWIKKYGVKADVYTRLSIKGIRHALSKGKLVIVSVNPNIRGYNTAPVNQNGGHLVLATGYDLSNDTISINNPSGFVSANTQIAHKLTTKGFGDFYAGRGIVLSKINQKTNK